MTHHLARRIERAFDTLDRAAADALCAPHYREHGAVTDPGPADRLGAVLTGLPPDFRYGLELTLCEGELLVLVGVCEGLPGGPLGAVDLFRVHDGLLVEHWDALGALPERPFAPLHLRRYEIPAPDSHRRLTERALALLGAEASSRTPSGCAAGSAHTGTDRGSCGPAPGGWNGPSPTGTRCCSSRPWPPPRARAPSTASTTSAGRTHRPAGG
ncbi:hypothetical protein [Kitasatospora albolonga]|uniref:nuclear transport factor 2 family protein n=1 Tax=Kitasatospora albolonga TaxID=68173 RepID=UPI0031E825F5